MSCCISAIPVFLYFFFYISEYNFDSFNECGIEIKSVVYVVKHIGQNSVHFLFYEVVLFACNVVIQTSHQYYLSDLHYMGRGCSVFF